MGVKKPVAELQQACSRLRILAWMSVVWLLVLTMAGMASVMRTPATIERMMSPHLHKRSSCYSCERQFQAQDKWMAQPSKCFSCERQMQQVAHLNQNAPFYASRSWHTV